MIYSSLIIVDHVWLSLIIIGHRRSFLVILDHPRSRMLIIDHPFVSFPLIFVTLCYLIIHVCLSLIMLFTLSFVTPSPLSLPGCRTLQVHALPSCPSNSRVHWPKPLRRRPRLWRHRIEVRASYVEPKLKDLKGQEGTSTGSILVLAGDGEIGAILLDIFVEHVFGTHVLDKDKVAEFEKRWPSPPASPKSVNVSLPKRAWVAWHMTFEALALQLPN